MNNNMKRRGREFLKSLLIVLLTLSAVVLMGRAQLYNPIPDMSDWMKTALSFPSSGTHSDPAGPTDLSTGLRPVCIAVQNESGRYGVHYDAETLNTVFVAQLGGLLGEALADVGQPTEISEEQWRQALCAQQYSVYYDFLGSVPLSVLSGWLSGAQHNTLTGEARRLLLAAGEEDTAVLYYSGDGNNSYYACTTKVEFEGRLAAVAADYVPNGALFAFQQETRYPNLEPYVMILPDPPVPVVFSASNPIAQNNEDAVMNLLLQRLSFQPQTSAIYQAADSRVVKEGKDTLRVGEDGTVIFHAADMENPRYPVDSAGDTPVKGELVETARLLVESGLGPWCGDAGFYLMKAESGQDGTLIVSFGYLLDGCAVDVTPDGYAARVVLRNGLVTDFTMHFRTYEQSQTRSGVLPEAQAVAAMNALDLAGSELQLRYVDGGGSSVTASWTAK